MVAILAPRQWKKIFFQNYRICTYYLTCLTLKILRMIRTKQQSMPCAQTSLPKPALEGLSNFVGAEGFDHHMSGR